MCCLVNTCLVISTRIFGRLKESENRQLESVIQVGGGIRLLGIFLWSTFHTTSWATLKCWSLPECYWPRLHTATSFRTPCHKAQTVVLFCFFGFFNMTVSSLHSNGSFGMRWVDAEIWIIDVLRDAVTSVWTKICEERFQKSCSKSALIEPRLFWRSNSVQ